MHARIIDIFVTYVGKLPRSAFKVILLEMSYIKIIDKGWLFLSYYIMFLVCHEHQHKALFSSVFVFACILFSKPFC